MLHATTITVLPDRIPCRRPRRGNRSALLGCVSVWGFLFLLVLTPATLKAQAPRYASYEVALELSRQIDKGTFQGQRIIATFIRRVEDSRYLLRLQLESGAEHEWDMHQLRRWTQSDALVLRGNRALVFTSPYTHEYATLDKNRFVRLALRSDLYRRVYREPDLLAGEAILYQLRTFHLVDLLGLAPATDLHGYPYRYALDLYNGERELLSYLEAYQVLQENNLGGRSDFAEEPQRMPYTLLRFETLPILDNPELGITEFGILLEFDRPPSLQPSHFPFSFYESSVRGEEASRPNTFVLEWILPNSELETDLGVLPVIEFLQDVHVVVDPSYRRRLLVRAHLNATLLHEAPRVGIDRTFVSLTLTKQVDQSVLDLLAVRRASIRRQARSWLVPDDTDAERRRQRSFEISIETGQRQLQRGRASEDPVTRLENYRAALANFSEAALQAATDEQLKRALVARNSVLVRIPRLVLDLAEGELESGQVPQARGLLLLVEDALVLADTPKLTRFLTAAKQQLETILAAEQNPSPPPRER